MDAQRSEAAMAATQITTLRAQCESLSNQLSELKMATQHKAELHRAAVQEKMLEIAELTQTRSVDAAAHKAELKHCESEAQQQREAAQSEMRSQCESMRAKENTHAAESAELKRSLA